jgi:DNA ligase-1
MPDLEVGESIEMKGSGARPYVIKNCGIGGYSCTCPAWRNQSIDPARRTCKHIRKLRGDAAEEARLGAAGELPSRKPEKAEDKEGPPVLLAEAWDNETNLAGWWMSEKLDGVRAYWDGKRFLSRQGNLFLAPAWFLEGLPDVPLDGELWLGRKAFQRTVSIARRQDMPPEWRELRYVIFDAPAHGGEFENRLRFLDDILGTRMLPFVQRLEHQQCNSVNHLRAELARIEAMGGEGLMMRQPGSRYEAGRSSTLLKVKTFHDAEARVIGYEAGAGKHKGRVGSLTVELPEGTRFSVGTGLSDAERVHPPSIGSIITFRYQEMTEAGVPRFPSYVGLRRDDEMTAIPSTPVAVAASGSAAIVVPAAPPSEAITRTFDYGSGAGARFWEVTLKSAEVTLRFGPAGGKIQTKTQRFASAMHAVAAVEEMIADKIDDGFFERGATTPAAAPAKAATKPSAAPTADRPGMRRFEYVEGTSSKFWEVWVAGSQMFTRYGRIGSGGQTTIKDFADEAGAIKATEKMIREKTGKGYVEKA